MKGILGRKVGMTEVFTTDGKLIPVTVVEVQPNVVYTIHGRYIIEHAIANDILASHYLDYIAVVRNKRRRLKLVSSSLLFTFFMIL